MGFENLTTYRDEFAVFMNYKIADAIFKIIVVIYTLLITQYVVYSLVSTKSD